MPLHPISAVADYCRRGWPVFPCNTQKRPHPGSRGFKDAHTDFLEHQAWWVDHPDDTIGIATGYSNGSRLLVIDLDTYKAGGCAEWDALASLHGGLPETYTVQTGQGGRQHYFTVDIPVRSSTESSRGDGVRNVDVRSDGGYVIGAGSVTIFGTYELIDSRPPVPAPDWVIGFAQTAKSLGVRSDEAVTPADLSALSPEDRSRLESYVERAVAGEVARLDECRSLAVADVRTYRGPAWDQTTYEVACNLIELANSPWTVFTEDDAHGLLLAHAPQDAGFGLSAVQAKWDSARKKVGTEGRAMPVVPAAAGYFIPFPGGDGGVIDPATFFSKGAGLNTSLLVQAVLDMGPLAIENTEQRSLWAYRGGVWRYAPNEALDRCSVLLGPRFRVNHVATILPPLRQRLAAEERIITCEPLARWINVQNGMLDWRSGVLHDHDAAYYSTVQLPVEWSPTAQCPHFDVFASEVMAPDAIPYLWEILGYLIYSGNPLQRAFLFHGAGSNGKGTLIRVLKSLLGTANTSAVTLADITEGKFDVASLFGKIANLAGDIDAAYMKSTAKFKAITGEDRVKAERKYEHSFEFTCWAVPVFSANEFWKSSDTTTGYRRRWQLLPFPNTFDVSSDRGLTSVLVAEKAGILVKAVAALRALMARGDFDTPLSARSEKERFELAADQVAEWLEDDPAVLIAKPADSCSTSRAEAYRQYRRWADDNGNGTLPSSKWWQRMDSLGYSQRKSGVTVISGLKLDLRYNVSGFSQVQETVDG